MQPNAEEGSRRPVRKSAMAVATLLKEIQSNGNDGNGTESGTAVEDSQADDEEEPEEDLYEEIDIYAEESYGSDVVETVTVKPAAKAAQATTALVKPGQATAITENLPERLLQR